MRDVFWPLAGTLLMQTVSAMLFLSVPVMAPVLVSNVARSASSTFDTPKSSSLTTSAWAPNLVMKILLGLRSR